MQALTRTSHKRLDVTWIQTGKTTRAEIVQRCRCRSLFNPHKFAMVPILCLILGPVDDKDNLPFMVI